MTILYVLTRGVTFFGAVLRTFWEHVACRICKIPVEDARVFKNDELCGHVEHELCENLKEAFLVTWLPFTLNFLMGTAFLLTGSYRLFFIGETDSLQTYALVWLGISCYANCAPSFEDMLTLKDYIYNSKGKVLKAVLSPYFAVVCGSAYLEKYSLTFVLSICMAIVLPKIVNLLFPVFDLLDQMIY